MIGDKILIQKLHKVKARKILFTFLNRFYKKNHKHIITIAGCSGTGKTEVAYVLRNLLYKQGLNSKVISLDDYYETNWEERNEVRKKKGLDYVGHTEIRWKLLRSIVDNFKSNKILKLQEIDKFAGSYELKRCESLGLDVLIVEGIYANYLDKVTFHVFLEGSVSETRAFRLERNKEKQTTFRELIVKKEYQEVLKRKNVANLIVGVNGQIREIRC